MTSDADVTEAKRALRHRARLTRRNMHELMGDSAAKAVMKAFEVAVPAVKGKVVSAYWPMGDEIDPRLLMLSLHKRGAIVALPVVVGAEKPLQFRRWTPKSQLEPGWYGTIHPMESGPAVTPDIVLVPLLAADRDGWRLGYGGGYYDRTLASLRAQNDQLLALGIAFLAQILDEVPHDQYDQKLDGLLTEVGHIDCRGRAS